MYFLITYKGINHVLEDVILEYSKVSARGDRKWKTGKVIENVGFVDTVQTDFKRAVSREVLRLLRFQLQTET